FLAAAQPGALYPLSLPFLLLPLVDAYGWYTAVHVAVAGLGMYALGRVLHLRVLAALYAAIAYMFSGFVIVYAVSPQMLGVAAWLPATLVLTELLLRDAAEPLARRHVGFTWVGGALIVGAQFLAGHPEMSAYLVLTVAAYAGLRALAVVMWPPGGRRNRPLMVRLVRATGSVAALLIVGGGLAAVQLLPTAEALASNIRQGARTLSDVLGYAWPLPQLWTLLLPDLFGNPSHHQWLDIWARQWRPVVVDGQGQPTDTIFWGVRNYVEGAQYVGVLSWLLVAIALLASIVPPLPANRLPSPVSGHEEQAALDQQARIATTWILVVIGVICLLFMLGTPLYAVLEYTLPGFQQLNTPFRWILPFTASVALLAGLGLQAVFDTAERSWVRNARRRVRLLAAVSLGASTLGCLALLAVAASLVLPMPFVGFARRVLEGDLFGKAGVLVGQGFASPEMFWSYEALGLVRLGLVAVLGGWLLFGLLRSGRGHWSSGRPDRRLLIGLLPTLLTGLDLFSVHGGFHASAEARLSPLSPDGRPPVVDFIEQREASRGDGQPWRFTTYNYWGENTLKANTGMYFGWQDIRGYESIIPRQYVALIRRLRLGSNELPYARIGPFYGGGDDFSPLDDPLLDLLNVKYILTTQRLPNGRLREIYRDEAVGVYENAAVYPRVFVAGSAVVTSPGEPFDGVDLRRTVLIDQPPPDPAMLTGSDQFTASARVLHYGTNQVVVQADLDGPGWLVLTDAEAPGWRATASEAAGVKLEPAIYRAYGAFRAVHLPSAGTWTVWFTYEPTSFRAGLLVSGLSVVTLALAGGFFLRRPRRSSNDGCRRRRGQAGRATPARPLPNDPDRAASAHRASAKPPSQTPHQLDSNRRILAARLGSAMTFQ
ncbi:MAG TPA: hypothetical protein VK898_02530, partial [Chloroflexota bacterium]|nr:hypothetical protein [Chloroflexota bacterium]